jgi:hypothetical protein
MKLFVRLDNLMLTHFPSPQQQLKLITLFIKLLLSKETTAGMDRFCIRPQPNK